jgi:hypothetical protein
VPRPPPPLLAQPRVNPSQPQPNNHRLTPGSELTIALVEHHRDGAAKTTAAERLGPAAQEKLRTCASAFYALDAARLREHPIELAVLREPARFQFMILNTNFSFDQRGPREFRICITNIESAEIPPSLTGLTIRFAKKSAP